MPLRSLRRQHLPELKSLSQAEAARKMVELNVYNGIRVLQENGSVIDAVRDRGLTLHPMVFDVACGKLQELPLEEQSEEEARRREACETWHGGQPPKKEEKKDEEKSS